MKYITKKRRLIAIFNAYLHVHNKTSATMQEVCDWATKERLDKPPSHRDRLTPELGEAWEKRLMEAAGILP